MTRYLRLAWYAISTLRPAHRRGYHIETNIKHYTINDLEAALAILGIPMSIDGQSKDIRKVIIHPGYIEVEREAITTHARGSAPAIHHYWYTMDWRTPA